VKVLITGFNPFGGDLSNPALEAVKRLPRELNASTLMGRIELIKVELPTEFYTASRLLKDEIERNIPDVVLCVGQAGGRAGITLEKVAINLNDARIPDNLMQQPIDEAIDPNGPTAYFTNLPIKAMVESMRVQGIPASVSYSAGTFVCNHVMYELMNIIASKGLTIKGGFMHVPYAHEQVTDRPTIPSMSLLTIIKAIEIAIITACEYEADLKTIGGSEC
jgi:pyroglutamyl-peptidase